MIALTGIDGTEPPLPQTGKREGLIFDGGGLVQLRESCCYPNISLIFPMSADGLYGF